MLTLHELYFAADQSSCYNICMTFLSSSITYFNGISKLHNTALLKIIAGMKPPVRGRIITLEQKPYCLYIDNELGLKNKMTVLENLTFWARLYNSLETLEASIHCFELQNILDIECGLLSRLDRKRVVLSKLISCQSDVWLLDEIDLDLDDKTKDFVRNLIISKANNGGIILMTNMNGQIIETAQILDIQDYKTSFETSSGKLFCPH
jgi:heme exporter protein A